MDEVVADGFIVVGPPVEVDSGRAKVQSFIGAVLMNLAGDITYLGY